MRRGRTQYSAIDITSTAFLSQVFSMAVRSYRFTSLYMLAIDLFAYFLASDGGVCYLLWISMFYGHCYWLTYLRHLLVPDYCYCRTWICRQYVSIYLS